jgi:antitoxin component YwqK of YwqJK toxin-antitoxin module
MKDGKAEGRWIAWDDKGQKTNESEYKNGEEIWSRAF